MTISDSGTITSASLINRAGRWSQPSRSSSGSSQLSQFMDQTKSTGGALTHKRRLPRRSPGDSPATRRVMTCATVLRVTTAASARSRRRKARTSD